MSTFSVRTQFRYASQTSCLHPSRLSELLNLPMPTLPAATQKSDSIMVSTGGQNEIPEEIYTTGGKWEDEEERRFFEDIQDLRDFVPKSVLGFTESEQNAQNSVEAEKVKDELERARKENEENEAKELEKELKRLELEDGSQNSITPNIEDENDASEEEYVCYIAHNYPTNIHTVCQPQFLLLQKHQLLSSLQH